MQNWQEIYAAHGPLVWKTVTRVLRCEAESLDCFQDVMLEAFEISGKQTIRNWPGLLRWIAVKRAIDRLRKRKRRQQMIDADRELKTVAGNGSPCSASLEMEELKQRLRDELADLPGQQAEAFWLRFVEQLSNTEIGEQMGVSANAVGVWVHRARAHIRNALADIELSNLT